MLRPDLLDHPGAGATPTGRALAERWHGKGRLRYAVTPRFSLSASEAMLDVVRGAARATSTALWFTSHINENLAEVATVARAVPGARALHRHLPPARAGRRRAACSRTTCTPPTPSWTCWPSRGVASRTARPATRALGSGLFPLRRHVEHGVRVALGSDVGAGTGFSLLKEGLQAYFMQQLLGAGRAAAHLGAPAVPGDPGRRARRSASATGRRPVGRARSSTRSGCGRTGGSTLASSSATPPTRTTRWPRCSRWPARRTCRGVGRRRPAALTGDHRERRSRPTNVAPRLPAQPHGDAGDDHPRPPGRLLGSARAARAGVASDAVTYPAWQPSLLDGGAVGFDDAFVGLQRRELADGAWVDNGPGWCRGADELFARLLAETPWRGRDRADVRPGGRRAPAHAPLGARRRAERRRRPARDGARRCPRTTGSEFTQVGVNLYRDGADSVAWHGDRVARELPAAVVALVSLGAARAVPAAATGGGPSGLPPGPGDLLVMGGTCQRTWQHAVPKAGASGRGSACSSGTRTSGARRAALASVVAIGLLPGKPFTRPRGIDDLVRAAYRRPPVE